MKKKLEITRKEFEAIKKYLKWTRGFEESSLYEDYKECEKFTDEEYDEVLATLEKLVERGGR
jgi:hypothetical protein